MNLFILHLIEEVKSDKNNYVGQISETIMMD